METVNFFKFHGKGFPLKYMGKVHKIPTKRIKNVHGTPWNSVEEKNNLHGIPCPKPKDRIPWKTFHKLHGIPWGYFTQVT